MNILKVTYRMNRIIGKMIPKSFKGYLKQRVYKISAKELFRRKKSPVLDNKLKGLNAVGPLNDHTGLGEAFRNEILALDSAGISYNIIEYSMKAEEMNNYQWDKNNKTDYSINLFHMNPDVFPQALKEFPDDFWINSYNIGWWVWELESIPKSWTYCLRLLDEIWVPSEFTADAIRKETDKPVTVIPIGISSPSRKNQYNRKYFNIPENGFVFLSMYDTDSYSFRKNPTAAIKAFKKAFSNTKDVYLILKIKEAVLKTDSKLKELIEKESNILLYSNILTRDEMNGLYQNVNCYVSLHRSEGYGLTMAEAMVNGIPCIATNWSGNLDFMNSSNALLVDYKFIPVGKNFLYGTNRQRWADADIDQTSEYMKKIFKDKDLYNSLSRESVKAIHEKLSYKTIGEGIMNRINEIYNK